MAETVDTPTSWSVADLPAAVLAAVAAALCIGAVAAYCALWWVSAQVLSGGWLLLWVACFHLAAFFWMLSRSIRSGPGPQGMW